MAAHPGEVDLRALMEPVARELLGEPNPHLSTAKVLRWGNNGSLAVDLEKGLFFSHENQAGGGTLALVEERAPTDRPWDWLRERNYVPPAAKTNGHAAPNDDGFRATYDYLDADRTLLRQVCRKEHPKRFVQRRPDGYGWSWSTKGVKDVPYRLPEVLEAIKAGRDVWIVEGEKDVDRLWKGGLAATCNAGGAGKWKPALNQYLKGASVVIVADNDPQAKDPHGEPQWHPDGRPRLPGQDHAADVARQLAPVSRRVRLMDLGKLWPACPAKGDSSDYLDAGHSIHDLQALADGLADWGEVKAPAILPGSFTSASLQGLPVPARKWHVPDLVPARTVTLLGGDGGVGKSILALQLAFATAAGLPWIGQLVRQGRALHLSAEDDRDELHRRNDQISVFYGVALERAPGLTMWSLADEDAVLINGRSGESLEPTSRWAELKRFIELDRPALIVLDSLADVYGANENERPQVRGFVRLLRGLAKPADTAVVLLGHPSLAGLSSGSGLSGSTAWNNSVRSRMFMSAPEPEEGAAVEPTLRTLAVKKANYAQAGAELRIRYVAGAFDIEGGAMASALDRQIADDQADALFLQLLDAFIGVKRFVSQNAGHAYAPALFAADPRAKGTSKKAFIVSMNRLFAAGALRVATRGPPSRQVTFIERA